MPDILFLPECYADTALVTMLLPSYAVIDHTFGVYNVVNVMRGTLVHQPAYVLVGIVDKDVTYKPKRRPPYFDDFVFDDMGNKITYGYKINTNEHLVMLDKAVDSFLLWNADEVAIDVSAYRFEPNLKKFCKAMKRTTIGSDTNYHQLLTDLRTRKAPGFLTLERILNDLIPA